MFHGHSNEQQLYHSIATVGTLLLELGEVGKRFYLKSTSESSQDGNVSINEVDSMAEYMKNVSVNSSPSKNSNSETEEAEKSSAKEEQSSTENSWNEKSGNDIVTQQDSGISDQSVESLQTNSSEPSSKPHSKPDSDWSISFEQFIASMLTEPPLLEYFEKTVDITDDIAKMRNRRLLNRQQSSFDIQSSKK